MSSKRRSWPATGSTQVIWQPSSGIDRDAGREYPASVPARIAALSPVLDPATRALTIAATSELMRFDSELGHRVQQFGPLLLRSEAASSSQIENLTASASSVLSAELGGRGGRNAGEVVANTRAMQAAIDLAGSITPDSILAMHRALLEQQPRHRPGAWRDEPVWIGTRSDSPFGASYVAPPFEQVPALIDDLIDFVHREDIDPLTKVAIAHAQFETIHPFTDGNGRTGRALAQSMLRAEGVTQSVAVPVSAGLLTDVEGYHAALDDYRKGSLDAIVSAFAHAASRAVANARQLIQEIDDVRASWNGKLAARRSSNAWSLLDLFAERPIVSAVIAAQSLGIATPNAYPPLRALTDAGIVQSKHEHKLGDSLWRADEILLALDRFADRAGRRTRDTR
jgi:Fic family protein